MYRDTGYGIPQYIGHYIRILYEWPAVQAILKEGDYAIRLAEQSYP